MEQQCRSCKELKPLSFFHKNKRQKNGYHYYCKSCCSVKHKAIYAANPEPVLEKTRERYRNNPKLFLEYSRAWRERNPERNKNNERSGHLRRKFKMTVDQFNLLLSSQGGVCAICETEEPGGRGTWHVDHDHACCPGQSTCGKCIRGILCRRCNTGLGMFSRESLCYAVRYLMKKQLEAYPV